jgi:hypothetical protein
MTIHTPNRWYVFIYLPSSAFSGSLTANLELQVLGGLVQSRHVIQMIANPSLDDEDVMCIVRILFKL